jgi:hypothetical protein
LFQDAIKTSQKRRCTIFFDPEYSQVYRSSSTQTGARTKLNPITFSKTGEPTYLINFLNTDLQKGKAVEIIIKDRSTSDASFPGAFISENNLSFNLQNKDTTEE